MKKLKKWVKDHPVIAGGLGTAVIGAAGYWGGAPAAELAQKILAAIFGG